MSLRIRSPPTLVSRAAQMLEPEGAAVATLDVSHYRGSGPDLGLVRPQATVLVGPQPPCTPFF